jgi:hypothetical protein
MHWPRRCEHLATRDMYSAESTPVLPAGQASPRAVACRTLLQMRWLVCTVEVVPRTVHLAQAVRTICRCTTWGFASRSHNAAPVYVSGGVDTLEMSLAVCNCTLMHDVFHWACARALWCLSMALGCCSAKVFNVHANRLDMRSRCLLVLVQARRSARAQQRFEAGRSSIAMHVITQAFGIWYEPFMFRRRALVCFVLLGAERLCAGCRVDSTSMRENTTHMQKIGSRHRFW